MKVSGRGGTAFADRFGSFTFLAFHVPVGMWDSRWEITLSRARFLSSLLATNHGAHDSLVAVNMASLAMV